MLLVFRERVESTWKGNNCFVFLFTATISQSKMNDFRPALVIAYTFLLISWMISA
jgi:hypothetical protein